MPSELPQVAYFTSVYPAASHTFILREITALERLGFKVLPCAIREPAQEQLIGTEEKEAHAKTFYVLKAAKTLSTMPLRRVSLMQSTKFLRSAVFLPSHW